MCTDPLAQLYLPQGQYVDCVRVADYCTVTVKETNVFHSQASISAKGLLATDYAIRANDFSLSSYDTRQRAGWGGEEEAQGRAHKRRGDWLQSVERTKKFEETDKLKYNISNWIWEVVQIWRQEALSWFSTAAANWFLYDSILAVGGNNNSFVYGKKKKKKRNSLEYKGTEPVHMQRLWGVAPLLCT